MRILAFTDIHGSLQALNRVKQKVKSQNPDLLVCAGDISLFERGITALMKNLDKLGKKIMMIHGNHESAVTLNNLSKLFKNIIFIHKTYFTENDFLFLGYGGGGFSIIDREFDRTAISKFKNIIKNNKSKKIILVTHAPPYKTRLDSLVGGALRQQVNKAFC